MRFGSALGGWSAHETELKLSPTKTVAWLVLGRADIYVSLVRVPPSNASMSDSPFQLDLEAFRRQERDDDVYYPSFATSKIMQRRLPIREGHAPISLAPQAGFENANRARAPFCRH
jgi:hypothetical protein